MKKFLEKLKEEPIKHLKFTEDSVSFNYDKTKIKNKIIVEKHEKCIGRWDVNLSIVYVDDDLDGLNKQAIAIHESIEKYISQKYDLDPYEEAHDIATAKEREFLEKNKVSWRSHQIKVGKIWKKEKKY